jgi:hypothetical protein
VPISENLSLILLTALLEGKLIKDGYKLHGHACESNGIVSRIKVHGSFAKAASRDGEELYFENQKLVRMKIYVPDDDWDKVRYDLSQKLGEPVSEPPQVYQNGFGAMGVRSRVLDERRHCRLCWSKSRSGWQIQLHSWH